MPPIGDRLRLRSADRGHTGRGSRVNGLTEQRGRVDAVDQTELFEAERPRLVRIASRVLGDHAEAEDVVQQAWLRLDRTDVEIQSLPAWLTTVTTRLCLDRLRSRTPVPVDRVEPAETISDPADDVALADTVGVALTVVLDRLSPRERVAFVLHDSFGFEFETIAAVLGTTPAAARKLASRARAKVAQPRADDRLADWEVVDAFMAAARNGDFDRLLRLLAPDAAVTADDAAILVGTPRRIEGRDEVATFFNGSAQSALPVFLGDQPGAAWFHLGAAKVVFDFTVDHGIVRAIAFRAAPDVLSRVVRRDGDRPRD
jgi:RNA polymerase sigma factor (sigma-70 family)